MKYFDDLINELKYTIVSNNKYYNLLSLYEEVKKNENLILAVDDKILLPFYIYNNLVYEIYDFELLIKVRGDSINKYVLEKTGKNKIEFVSEDIFDKLKNCYLPLKEKYINNTDIITYIEYICNNNELKERLRDIYGKFDVKNLFFEIY